jgi:hypothetical protein
MSDITPVYEILTMQLTTAQLYPQAFRGKWNYLRFFDCRDPNGNQALTGTVNVLIGHRNTDPLPMGINSLVRGDTEEYQFSWPAQPGLVAYFLATRIDENGNGVMMDAPPSRQLVSSAVGLQLTGSRVTVANVATLIAAGNVTRQRVTMRNKDAVPVFIGGAGVTAANGFGLDPGDVISIDGTTAPVWGITASGAANLHVLVES